MAESTVAPTNKSVKFGLKPAREHVRTGKLPRKKRAAVRKLQARGMISETARKKHGY